MNRESDADKTTSDRAPSDLVRRLKESLASATRTEGAIASYILGNLQSLPFETAGSLGRKVGVSEASIGRYCRAIGYRHFKDLKGRLQADLGDTAWLIGDRLRDFHARSLEGATELAHALEKEIAAVVAVYEIAAGADFARAVERLTRCREVYVAGFQTERGHAAQLVHNLQYLRPGVHLADLAGGHFAEVLMADPKSTALVLIDGRRYSRLTQRLAMEAKAAGIGVTLITDPYCDWARGNADEVFVVQTDLNSFWDTTSAMASLIGLIVSGVFRELGAGVEERLARVSSLYNEFVGHVGSQRAPQKQD